MYKSIVLALFLSVSMFTDRASAIQNHRMRQGFKQMVASQIQVLTDNNTSNSNADTSGVVIDKAEADENL